VVPPASRPITRVGRYSGTPLLEAPRLHLPGCHRLGRPIPGDFGWLRSKRPWVLQPRGHKDHGLGSGPVRSPLLGASRLISLPPGTEMFQFPGFASRRSVMTGLAPRRVSPFGHPGLTGCVLLPPAYRSLPRPSSPLCAQASPTYLRSLDYNNVSSRARAIYTSECINSERHEAAHRLLQSPDDDSSSAITSHFHCQTALAYAPPAPLRAPDGTRACLLKPRSRSHSGEAATSEYFRDHVTLAQDARVGPLLVTPVRR
jgi:hypothetical protein